MISSVSVSSMAGQAQQLSRPQGPPPPPNKSGEARGPDPAAFDEALAEVAEAAGLSEDEISSLKSSIQTAIDALDGETDPRAIGAAVSEELEEYGVDPDAFHERLGPPPSGGRAEQQQATGTYSLDLSPNVTTQSAGYDIFRSLYALDVQA